MRCGTAGVESADAGRGLLKRAGTGASDEAPACCCAASLLCSSPMLLSAAARDFFFFFPPRAAALMTCGESSREKPAGFALRCCLSRSGKGLVVLRRSNRDAPQNNKFAKTGKWKTSRGTRAFIPLCGAQPEDNKKRAGFLRFSSSSCFLLALCKMAMAGPNPQQLSQQAIKALTLKGFSYSNPSGEPLVFMVNFPDAKSDVTSSSPDLLAMRLLVRINPNNRTCNLRVGNGQPCNAAHLVKCIDFINECNSREEFGEWVVRVRESVCESASARVRVRVCECASARVRVRVRALLAFVCVGARLRRAFCA